MRADDAAAWEGVAELLAVASSRLVDALPATGRIIADVQADWDDVRGREWVERAQLVRRALERELDATLAAARAVGDALRLGPVAVDPGNVLPTGYGRSAAGGSRPGGPRLGGTDAERVDEERGMRIAQLGDDPG